MGSGKVTLQTIADAVGVSRMTVSNAFSRPDQLSAELRERIMTTASELGYAGPDPAARRLARGNAGTVGILLTDSLAYAFDDEIAAGFVGAVAGQLASTGLALTLLTSTEVNGRLPARDIPMDGALVYSCELESTSIDWLVRRRLPLVFVDDAPRPGYDSVNIDDRGGARLAAHHLIDLGHRRVGILTAALESSVGVLDDPVGQSGDAVGHQRVSGWLDVLAAAGAETVVVQHDSFGEEAGRVGVRTLLAAGRLPTALLCVSDVTAFGAIQELSAAGLAVPDDVSVVGFDGTNLAARLRPSLTTVHQDVEAKGRAAATFLIERVEALASGASGDGQDADLPARAMELPVKLVIGQSTSPPT